MTVKELKEYIKKHKLKDSCEIIINNGNVNSYGICIQSPLHKEIGDYLSITSYNTQELYNIRKIEKYLSFCMKQGYTREESKDLYMDKYVNPYKPKCITITKDHIFYYEKNIRDKWND